MVELLAPARDFTALEAALKNGANAVYIGVENYNMRSHAPNFTMKNSKKRLIVVTVKMLVFMCAPTR